jgi:hypothetical protein
VTFEGSAGTAMLGLGGFVLLAVSSAYGELEQAVETIARTVWCEGCGVAARPHGRRAVLVRDLPASGWSCDVAVAEAAVALPRVGVRCQDVVGDQRACSRARVADGTGTVGSVSAGR